VFEYPSLDRSLDRYRDFGILFLPRESGDLSFVQLLRGAARRAVATERPTFELYTRRPYLTSRLRRSRWTPHRRRPTKRSVCRRVRELLWEARRKCQGIHVNPDVRVRTPGWEI
jgi:hypothetical protein